jgi:T1SS-143 domain-containing protein
MAPTNAQPVGRAILVYGTVKAVAANGTERILGPNSLIYANEHIVTGSDGSVSIAFTGHPEQLMLGRMSDVTVDEDVYASTTPGQGEGGTASVENIQAALLQDPNFDPTTGLPAPAAGGGVAGAGVGPRGGGRQIVVFDADQMEVTPDSGAETRGIALNFLDPPGGLGTEDVELIVADAAVRISEEGLSGADPDDTGATTGDDTTNTTFIAGTLAVTTTSNLALSFTFADAPAGLTSNGVGITWAGIGTGILIGTAGGQTILTVTIDSDGDYSVSLGGPLDHLAAGGENTMDLSFGVRVTDGLVSASANLTVTVEDDAPVLGPIDPAMLPYQAGTVSGQFDLAQGADGIDHFNITPPVIDGITCVLGDPAADGTTVLYGNSTAFGGTVFTLTVRPDGTYAYEFTGASVTYSMSNLAEVASQWVETNDGRIEFSSRSTTTIKSNGIGFGVGDDAFVGKGEYFDMEFHSVANSGNDLPNSSAQQMDRVVLTVNAVSGAGGTYQWIAANTATGVVESGYITITATGEFVVDPGISFNTLRIRGIDVSATEQGVQFSQVVAVANVLDEDALLKFQIAAVDNDGDVSATQELSIQYVPYTTGQGGVVPSQYNFTGSDADDWIAASTIVDAISGGGGMDVVDYSDSTAAIAVNLDDSGHAQGTPSDITTPGEGQIGGGDAAGDILTGVEGVVGGTGNDVLFGNVGNNFFDGGSGADTVNGEGGNDEIVYDNDDILLAGGDGHDTLVVKEAATINLSDADQSGSGDTPRVTGFESVDASDSQAAVNLTGESGNNKLYGGTGDDTLDGGAGDDTLSGGKGADTFMASIGSDVVTDYNKGEGDVVDISNLLSDASMSDLSVGVSAAGHAQLIIDYGGAEVASFTFETIDNGGGTMTLDSLLHQVEVKDGNGTV